MKKYTNKILLITFLVLLVALSIGLTIKLWDTYHTHPEYFGSRQQKNSVHHKRITHPNGDTVFIHSEGDTFSVIKAVPINSTDTVNS